jgi:hypothetical protein
MRWVWWTLVALACGDKSTGTDSGGAESCDPTGVADGAVEATVDGFDWAGADATWMWSGSSLQIMTTEIDGFRITMVGQETDAGNSVEDAMATGGAHTVDIGPGGGGFAILYAGSSSYGSEEEQGSGTMQVSLEDGVLVGCFSFVAASSDNQTIPVESGVIRATESSVR